MQTAYINLGYANGWDSKYRDTDGIPPIVAEAREKGYKIHERMLDNHTYEYWCDELRFRYKTDCS